MSTASGARSKNTVIWDLGESCLVLRKNRWERGSMSKMKVGKEVWLLLQVMEGGSANSLTQRIDLGEPLVR